MSKAKCAIITGITGQDGSYLAELLLEKGYVVHGIIRRSSSFNTGRVDHMYDHPNLTLHYGDMTDGSCLNALVAKVRPDEVYNLAAQSHVKVSFESPDYTGQVDGIGTLKILDAIRSNGLEKTCRFYQASTSELYGLVQETPQSETTPFYPRSPYAVAKLYAFWIVKNYRESYDMFACNGILFNHESPRRGATFVTKKIVRAAVRIKHGKQKQLLLGNLNALRDWGHAKDYVHGMWLILQQDKPEDFVLATGEQHSVKEFCEAAFTYMGYELVWEGEGVHEFAYDKKDPTKFPIIAVDEQYFRPAEVETLLGNPAKARKQLGWRHTYSFKELVEDMMKDQVEEVVTGKDDWNENRIGMASAATAEAALNQSKAQLAQLNHQVSLLERGAQVDYEQLKQAIAEALPPLQQLQQGMVPLQGGTVQAGSSEVTARTGVPRGAASKAVSELQLRRATQMLSELQLIETTVKRFERKAQQAQANKAKMESLVGSSSGKDTTDYSAMDSLEQERKALLYTRQRIQQLNQQSDSVLDQLMAQGRRLGGIGDGLNNILDSLGVSNTTIGQIIRRNKGDAWIVYCGIAALLLLMWYIW